MGYWDNIWCCLKLPFRSKRRHFVMSSSSQLHVIRNIRLQLKTGFMRQAPSAYTLLRRYPPLSRDTSLPVREVKTRNIPYLHFYDKVLEENPLYSDEKVYSAFWRHEPQALTLAKKWYEMTQKGMSEKDAYIEAQSHVQKNEDQSYLKLKNLVKDLSNGNDNDLEVRHHNVEPV